LRENSEVFFLTNWTPTRGKTAANRLRRVDNFIPLYEAALLSRDGMFADSLFVDLGYGVESAALPYLRLARHFLQRM
jgi:hypothetical protein